jgi:hypothetical protein
MSPASSGIENRIARHFTVFQDLVATAEEFAANEEWTAAAAYAGMAATYATWNHAGLFTSPRLETILARVGKTVAAKVAAPRGEPHRSQPVKKVLHVLTEGYGLGGHTRLAWRWIRADTGRSHSIAFTRQGARAVPPELIEAVERGQGQVYLLDAKRGGLLSWARTLRQLAFGFDRIVLHIHPSDVVPLIAFADKQDLPPVIFLNHADHLFWLGLGISDVVAHIRESSMTLSQELRGLSVDRCAVLPIPIDAAERQMTRLQARQQLGLSENALVLLSVASKYKFEPILNDLTLVDLVLPVLAKHEKAVLLVVGPTGGPQWEKGKRKSSGRIRTLGPTKDMAVLYQAADIYLDSYPVSSFTSLLEAGSYGSPLLNYWPLLDSDRLARPDCPGFANTLIRTIDPESYRSQLTHLLQDSEARSRLGEETKDAILGANTGAGWLKYLERLYSMAGAVSPALPGERPAVDVSRSDGLNVRLLSSYDNTGGTAHLLDEIFRTEASVLPFLQRIKLWIGKFPWRLDVLPYFLLSDWARVTVRKLIPRRGAA